MLLSIIALISTPIISKIIMNAKIKTYQINASEIINLSEVYFISNHDFNSKYTIIDLTKNQIKYKGKKIDSGFIAYNSDGQTFLNMIQDNYCIIKKFEQKKVLEVSKNMNCEVPNIVKAYFYLFNSENNVIEEEYIGNYKLVDLKNTGLGIDGKYYINKITKEIYSVSEQSFNDIAYHSLDDYFFIMNNSKTNSSDVLKTKYKQLEYIKNSSLSDGAITTYGPDSNKMIPYFNITAASGMLSNIGTLNNVKQYIKWHLNNINLNPDKNGLVGTIYDVRYIKSMFQFHQEKQKLEK